MKTPGSELARWARGIAAAERRCAAERRGRPPSPAESWRKARELARLAGALGVLAARRETTPEDLRAYRAWVRLRRGSHA